jgi:hypothetical protein
LRITAHHPQLREHRFRSPRLEYPSSQNQLHKHATPLRHVSTCYCAVQMLRVGVGAGLLQPCCRESCLTFG